MTALSSILYLCLCVGLGWRALGWVPSRGPGAGMLRLQVFGCVFFVAFFAGFHLTGYLALLTGRGLATVPYALCALALLGGASCLLTAPATANAQQHATAMAVPLPGVADSRGWLPAATLLAFGTVALMLMSGFPHGYEVSAYHLPVAVAMLQSHTLAVWDGNFPHNFPANASVFFYFFLGFVPEKMVSAVNLIFLLPLAFSVMAISRRVGADRHAAALVACGLLSVPMIAFSAVELSADVGGIAFIAMAMYFALARVPSAGAGALLAGLCAGLALGFKSLHLISIALLALVVCAGAFAGNQHPGAKLLAAVRLGAVFCGATGLMASFWLVRNYLDFGNPLFPVNLPIITDWMGWPKAADVDFLARLTTQFEWVRSTSEWLVYPWVEWQNIGQNFKHSAGLGAFVAASVPATLGLVSAAIVRQGARRHRERLPLLLAVFFTLGIWWVLADRQPRYMLAALPFSMPLVAWLATQAERDWRPALNAILGLCIATMLLVFVSKEALLWGDRIVLSGYTTRSLYYEYPKEIDNLPAGAVILNLDDRGWHYPLAGSRLSNRVVSMAEGRRVMGLPPDLTAPREVRLRAAALRALGVTHLFVARTALIPDPCLRLTEAGRTDRNPANGKLLDGPRRLLAVAYLDPAAGGACAEAAAQAGAAALR